MTWEETRARLEKWSRHPVGMVRLDMVAADIRAALERDEQGHAACVRHGCGCNDAGATRVECPEHAALRQRVEELEGRVESLTDRLSSTTEDYIRHRNALHDAEAKLAQVVEERDDAYRCKHERDRRIGELMAEVGYLTRERDEARAKLAKVVEAFDKLESGLVHGLERGGHGILVSSSDLLAAVRALKADALAAAKGGE